MIFTTAVIPFRGTPSLFFKEKGDHNGYPGTVSDSRTYVLTPAPSTTWNIFRATFQSIVAATAKGVPIYGHLMTALYGIPTSPSMIFPLPPVAVGVRSVKEETDQLLTGYGFVKDQFNKLHFYRGQPLVSQLASIANLDIQHDNFSPQGFTNFEGLQAFFLCEKVIHLAVKSFLSPAIEHGKPATLPIGYEACEDSSTVLISPHSTDDAKVTIEFRPAEPEKEEDGAQHMENGDYYQIAVPVSADVTWKVSKPRELPKGTKGIFFPYFHGMLIADKITVPEFITTNLITLLGDNETEIEQNVRVINSGWGSCSSTPSAMALTHLAFGIKIALAAGAKPVLCMKDSLYQGFFLVGERFKISSKGQIHVPVPRKSLVEEFEKFDSHDASISKIVEIINTCPLEKDKESFLTVSEDLLSTPRIIHNLLRSLVINSDRMKELTVALSGLNFDCKYWDPRKPADVLKAFRMIAEDKFLDDDCPILYKNAFAMTAKANYISTLAAFGNSAPSLLSAGGRAIPIRRGRPGEDTERDANLLCNQKTNGGNLLVPNGNIPIFVKALQEACTDFDNMKRNNFISFKLTPRGSVAGTTTFFRKDDAIKISRLLAKHFAEEPTGKSVGKKRKRDVNELTPKELEEESERRKQKKTQTTALSNFWLNVGGGQVSKPVAPEDVEMDAE